MNAGFDYADPETEDKKEAPEESKEIKEMRQRLQGVKVSQTEKVTLTGEAEYGILRKKLTNLTGSVAW